MVAALDLNKKTYIINMAYLKFKMIIDFTQKIYITLLLDQKVIIFEKYSNFINIFSKKLTIMLSKHFNINKYTIYLNSNKYLFYWPIYNLGLVELKFLKTYIETNLVNNFI